MTPNALNYIVHKTLLKSLQKHYQTIFSRFLATTTFVPAENTLHIPGRVRSMLPKAFEMVGGISHRARGWALFS
jgi:hypothetical protein